MSGPTLFIYLVERDDFDYWDEYDSFVIAASSEQAARACAIDRASYRGWPSAELVTVTLLGTTMPSIPAGVLHDYFRAG